MEHYQTTIVYNAQFQREGGRNEAKPRWQEPLTTMAKNLVDRARIPACHSKIKAWRAGNPDKERRDKLATHGFSGLPRRKTLRNV